MPPNAPVKRLIRRLLDRLPPPRDEAAIATLRSLRALVTGDRPPPTRAASERLDQAFSAGEEDAIRGAVDEVHASLERAETLATPAWIRDGGRLSRTRGIASMQYMIDLLPQLQVEFGRHPPWSQLSLLDVGPGTGHGTALLSTLYATPRLGYQLDISVLDVRDTYRRYIGVIAPEVPFIHEDAFDHQQTYDYVIASHVIEHVPDPVGLFGRLQDLAHHAVLLVAPFEEPADDLARGHVRVVDDDLMEAVGADRVTKYYSTAWGAFMDPPYRSVIARLPGRAAREPAAV